MNLSFAALLLAAGAAFSLQAAQAKDSTPQPPYPAEAQSKNEHGSVKLAITFAADGSVKSVRVTNPRTQTHELEEGTCTFIKENWNAPSFAGTTQHTAIDFNAPSGGGGAQASGPANTPAVPYPQEARDHYETGDVKVAVTFAADGSVKSVKILNANMNQLYLDRATRSFILDQWKDPAFAGTTQTTTISFGSSGSSADTSPISGGGSGSSSAGGGHVAH